MAKYMLPKSLYFSTRHKIFNAFEKGTGEFKLGARIKVRMKSGKMGVYSCVLVEENIPGIKWFSFEFHHYLNPNEKQNYPELRKPGACGDFTTYGGVNHGYC